MLITTAVDVFWLLFWFPYYNTKEQSKLNYGLHMTVCLVSVLEIVLKVIVFIALFSSKSNNRKQQPFPEATVDKGYHSQ